MDEEIKEKFLVENEEKALYKYYQDTKENISEFIKQKKYQNAYKKIAAYQEPLALFFEKVFIDTKDEKLKNNRLKLLSNIEKLMIKLPIIFV